ncbi:tetratricopeptide repeat protein [uncultured Tenacibaculum sp.]|uniref:tetratricopeptide repeat protein n=1 Tax=uncultured Tenacibaculum sp. TaxID=174713 RepID=UPI00260A1209|nr:tetratricopeptide repeat protein [uncultured Tenacibaculum sp.]
MKKIAITFLLLSIPLVLASQENFKKFIEVGISNHDKGRYKEAIKYYKKALEIKPNSELANYEISLSLFSAKEYRKAIKYSNKIIKKGKKHLLPAYINKGSALDMLGKTKKSIKVFEEGIKKIGDNYLLHFNLAVNYLKVENYKKGEIHLKKAIRDNPVHGSSHFYLAKLNNDKGNKIPTLLASYYFLLIEPNTIRTEEIFDIFKRVHEGVVKIKDKGGKKNIIVNVNSNSNNEFGAHELMWSMLIASKELEENKNKTKEELFIKNTGDFFEFLGEFSSNKKRNFWNEFYIPFFYKIAKSEHLETYCKLITQVEVGSQKWLDENEKKVKVFFNWANKEFK